MTFDEIIARARTRAQVSEETRSDGAPVTVVWLDPADARDLGVYPEVHLQVEHLPGSYAITYLPQGDDSQERTVCHEPAEPDRQVLGVEYARRNPVGAALDLLFDDLVGLQMIERMVAA